jgi:hypothetical protein
MIVSVIASVSVNMNRNGHLQLAGRHSGGNGYA